MKNNNSSFRNNQNRDSDTHYEREGGNKNDNSHQQNTHYDKRKQNQQQQQPSPHRQQYQGQRSRSDQRDRGPHTDSSIGRDGMGGLGNPSNLGSVKFTPGYPTRELPPIETKADPSKKFTGRCRLFVGNLPHNTTEEKLRSLFEPFGEIGEVFLGPKSAFAFVKMDTKQSAEAARNALDCSIYEGRALRVRLAAHAAAIRVKHLSPQVTNELLAYAFRYFGEIERAVVVVDDKGKSIGEGIVEYSKKQSAQYAIKRCQQECFMLTASPKPVLVEPFDQQDEDEGLPEKSINRNSIEFKEQRDVGPRFAEQGTFEHTFALRWKELYAIEKQKRECLEQEIQEARKNLQDQIEYSRLEHDTMQLRSKLQQLEDNRMKLQQMKEQSMNDAQQRDEQRRQQDMLIRQREEDILRRQQLGDPNGLSQQESVLRSQAHALQNMLSNQETVVNQGEQQKLHASGSQMNQDMEQSMPMNPQVMLPGPRTFADTAIMGVNQPYMQVPQPTMSIPPPQNPPPNMFPSYIPPPPIQSSINDNGGNVFGPYQQQGFSAPSNNQQLTNERGNGRQQKYGRQFTQGNNVNVAAVNNNGRPRKRGRF